MWGRDGVDDNYPLHDLSKPVKVTDTIRIENSPMKFT
jgi:hypothetical protein